MARRIRKIWEKIRMPKKLKMMAKKPKISGLTRKQRIAEIKMEVDVAKKKAKKMAKPLSIAKETIKGMPAAAKKMPSRAIKTGKKVANYARFLAGGREYGLKQNMRTPDGMKYVERYFPKDYKRLLRELGINK